MTRDGESIQNGVAQQILRALEGIRYGSLEIVIHDSRIVQIERKEKIRYGCPADLRT